MVAFVFKNKIRLGIVLVCVLIATLAYQKWGRAVAPIKWKTGQIERGNIYVTVTATGTLQAVITVQVGTQVSGTVSAIYVDYNSQVKKSQVIARIDTTLLKASLTDAIAALERSDAQAKQTTEILKRTQTLFERTLVSQSELDQAIANARVSNANMSSARAQVDRAKINLRYATIVSPIDGIVLSKAIDVGQTVAASFNTPTLFTIAGDLKQMQVQASIDEADIGKIKLGQKSTFRVDAYPDSLFTAEVKQIRLQPNTVQNVVSYEVMLTVNNTNLKLMPGMTANLTVVVSSKENVLTVPAAALRFEFPEILPHTKNQSEKRKSPVQLVSKKRMNIGDTINLFILENENPKAIPVVLGISDGSRTEITNEVANGTEVITGMDGLVNKKPQAPAPFGMGKSPSGGGGRYH